MYLAPLNYDRFFKKVFSNLDIARRFLEDFLDIKIEKLEFLPNKYSVTNDAQTVEFDFHCKTKSEQFIIEMQQWYKHDIVQHFYVYHALGVAFQLEDIKEKLIPLSDGNIKKIKDYSELLPTITIIWMVQATYYFTDDYIVYILTPEYIKTFLKDSEEWIKGNYQLILEKRKNMSNLIINAKDDIDFLKKNKLIYAFQKNIVKNGKLSKYYNWFEFAQKTLNKVSDRFEYDKYRKDKIFCEMIRRLETSLAEDDSMEYIKNYEEYQEGVERYNRGVVREHQEEHEKELLKVRTREEEAKAREKEAKAREKEAKAREEEERRQKEEAKAREKEANQKLAKKMIKYGETIEDIIVETGLSKDEVKKLM